MCGGHTHTGEGRVALVGGHDLGHQVLEKWVQQQLHRGRTLGWIFLQTSRDGIL